MALLFIGGFLQIGIGGWLLEKADHSTNEMVIPVRMIANRLKLDRENQELLPQAFDSSTVNNFLENGIIDWFHKSRLGKSDKEKADAVLGKPTDFRWEEGLPVVYGDLTRAHPIVRDSIAPHLEAGNDVFGASVGGGAIKRNKIYDPVLHKAKEQISKIYWDHIAIAPSAYIVSLGSKVSLAKARNGEVFLEFDTFNGFILQNDLVGDDAKVNKALEVDPGNDTALFTGADALIRQSLDGVDVFSEYKEQVFKALFTREIPPTQNGIRKYLHTKGVSQTDIDSFLKNFQENVYSLVNKY